MSSFSSVVHKPGKKIVPKAAPRRNVQRKPVPVASPAPSTQVEEASSQQHDDASAGATQDVTEGVNRQEEATFEQTFPQTATESPVIQSQATVDTETQILPTVPETDPQPEPASPPRISVPEVPPSPFRSARQLDKTVDNPVRQTPNQSFSKRRGRKRSASNVDFSVEPPQSVAQEPLGQSAAVNEPEDVRTQVSGRSSISTRSSKRRKTNLHPSIEPVSSQNSPTISRSSATPASPVSRRSNQSQPPLDLLQSATQRAASVSELANTIESYTRSLRPPAESDTTRADVSSDQETNTPRASASPRPRPKHRRGKKTAQEQAAEVVANVIGSSSTSSRLRDATPENAESYVLEPTKVKMGDLCKDRRLGKKSALESEMQANWSEILQRRKEDRERAIANAEKRRRKGFAHGARIELPEEPVAALAPSMTVVNGVIVVDQSSREIDRGAQLQQAMAENGDNVREDKDYYKYVNQGTVGMKPGHSGHTKWDQESTERFFRGLRMFGTDFLMIANMFPGITRKQIKTKFIREENADKAKVLDCLRNRLPVELEDYAQMTQKDTEEFQTLESIQKELEEQEKQLREEDNQRRKREGFVTNGANGSNQQPVSEGGNRAEDRTESAEPGRFDNAAREIMEAAVAPKKRQRKTNATNNRRGAKNARRYEGGVEEVLGSINEVAV